MYGQFSAVASLALVTSVLAANASLRRVDFSADLTDLLGAAGRRSLCGRRILAVGTLTKTWAGHLEMLAQTYAEKGQITPGIYDYRRPLEGRAVAPLPKWTEPAS